MKVSAYGKEYDVAVKDVMSLTEIAIRWYLSDLPNSNSPDSLPMVEEELADLLEEMTGVYRVQQPEGGRRGETRR